jgi:gamma-glutamylputrescine oxidase
MISRRAVVLSTHVGTHELSWRAGLHTVPLTSYVVATEPLSEAQPSTMLPLRNAVYDTQLQIDYYRFSADNRLIFGGLGSASMLSMHEVVQRLRRRIAAVFPQACEATIEHAWSGTFDVTLNGATRACLERERIYLIHGWNGHGVAQSVWAGRALGQAILGDTQEFAILARIGHKPLPLGRQLAPMLMPTLFWLLHRLRARYPHKAPISF